LIARQFGYTPLYRVATRDGRICGVLPAFEVKSLFLGRHMISVPFLNSGGICASDESAEAALLSDAYAQVCRCKARHMEMRCSSAPPECVPARQHKVRIVLDLPKNPDELWNSLRGEIRNRTRRAQNAGLKVEFASAELEAFYAVFADNMRDLGVPAHPKQFFQAVLDTFGRQDVAASSQASCQAGRGSSELVVVKAGSEVIGGAILFSFRDTIEVPWISCSRSHFELCPNNILYWEIMRRACEEGKSLFDFGRSSPHTGPATFKMRWGARVEQLHWWYVLPENAQMPAETGVSNPRFQRASALWTRAPRVVTSYLGPKLIRHLPG